MIKSFKKILLFIFMAVFAGFFVGYLFNKYKMQQLKKQNKDLLHKITISLKRVDSLSGAIDSMQTQDNLIFNEIEFQDSSKIGTKNK
jgi:hypothetical protein